MPSKTPRRSARITKTAAARPGGAKPANRATPGKVKPAASGSRRRSAARLPAPDRATGDPASELITRRIRELGDWRGQTLARVRELVREADPDIVEEWKWETPVWSHGGLVCTGEAHKNVVKLTFPKGASLKDPSRLFNASLDGNVRRAVDIREGDRIDEAALKQLIQEAVALNLQGKSPPAAATPKLLSGGNPQIAKGYGDAPVQAYIAAMPGWKRDVGRRLDALIGRTVPGVRKAVKYNSPLYGVDGRGWFLGVHCFNKYVKVTFFRGASLRPVPPGESRQKDVRHLDIREGDPLDEAQFAAWLKQASQLPGQDL